MNRAQANKDIALIECINPYTGKYRIRWDVRPEENESTEDIVSFYEADMVKKGKLSLNDIQEAVLGRINQEVDKKILSGFTWKDMAVWLSSENQFNYKAAYDMAVQLGEAALPVVFKFGSTSNPEYYEFSTLQELQEFYIGAMHHISETLKEGWQMKDSVDWGLYEHALKDL